MNTPNDHNVRTVEEQQTWMLRFTSVDGKAALDAGMRITCSATRSASCSGGLL